MILEEFNISHISKLSEDEKVKLISNITGVLCDVANVLGFKYSPFIGVGCYSDEKFDIKGFSDVKILESIYIRCDAFGIALNGSIIIQPTSDENIHITKERFLQLSNLLTLTYKQRVNLLRLVLVREELRSRNVSGLTLEDVNIKIKNSEHKKTTLFYCFLSELQKIQGTLISEFCSNEYIYKIMLEEIKRKETVTCNTWWCVKQIFKNIFNKTE